jgi:hypothetical protein
MKRIRGKKRESMTLFFPYMGVLKAGFYCGGLELLVRYIHAWNIA